MTPDTISSTEAVIFLKDMDVPPKDEDGERGLYFANHIYDIEQIKNEVGEDTVYNWFNDGTIQRYSEFKKTKIRQPDSIPTYSEMDNDISETIPQLPELFDSSIYCETNNGKTAFKAAILAKDICFTNEGINRGFLVPNDNKKILWYNCRYWQDNGEEIIKDITQQILDSKACSRHKTEVISWIKDCFDLQIDRERLDGEKNKLGLQNGVYDVITHEYNPFHPKYLLTSLLPIKYDPMADCPVFEEFISEVVEETDIPVIQEMMGYCLYKGYPIAAIFMLIGSGRNGKSTLTNVIISLLGKHNVSTVPIQALAEETFAGIDLYHRHANICGDLTNKELDHTGKLKQLTGEDYFRARDLYEKSMKFVNYAKLISCMNEIPHCHDNTLAWAERIIVVEFPNKFLAGEPDTDLNMTAKLTTPEELSGIFNWAMLGLDRLFKNGMFSPHKNLKDVEQYITNTKNSVLQFVKNCVDRDPQGEVLKDDVYKAFLGYSKDNNLTTVSSNHFSNRFKDYLMEMGIPFEQGHIKAGRTWKGIALLTEPRKETEEEKQHREKEEAAGLDRFIGLSHDEVREVVDDE